MLYLFNARDCHAAAPLAMTFFVRRSQKQSLEHVIARNFSSEAISGIRKAQMLYLFNARDCHAAAPLAMTFFVCRSQ